MPLIGLFVACLTSGCGTFLNQQPPGSMSNIDGERRPYRAYGGVRTDLDFATQSLGILIRGEHQYGYAFLVPLFIAADLPFSAVADTLLLPWDLKGEIKWRRDGRPSPKVTPQSPEPDQVGRVIVEGTER
jgi:uncharacterized protein YceK